MVMYLCDRIIYLSSFYAFLLDFRNVWTVWNVFFFILLSPSKGLPIPKGTRRKRNNAMNQRKRHDKTNNGHQCNTLNINDWARRTSLYKPEVTSGPSERYAMPAPHVTCIMLTLLSENTKRKLSFNIPSCFHLLKIFTYFLKRSHLFGLFREQTIDEKSRKIMKHKENMNILRVCFPNVSYQCGKLIYFFQKVINIGISGYFSP